MLDSFMKKIDYDMAMNDDEDLVSPECWEMQTSNCLW